MAFKVPAIVRVTAAAVLGIAPGGPALAQSASVPEPSKNLLALSRDLTRLKDGVADSRVKVYVNGRVHLGLYLGDGVVATSHVPGLEGGETAVLRGPTGSYRLLGMAGDRRLELVSFFKLRDWPDVDPEPRVPRFSDPDWRTRQGDLVCIVGSRAARLAMVEESISFRWSGRKRRRGHGDKAGAPPERTRGQTKSESEHPGRFVFGYGMTDAASTPGSFVLAMDGGLIGMLVRRKGAPEPPKEKKEKADESERDQSRSSRSPGASRGGGKSSGRRRDIVLVLDVRWLEARGRRSKARPLASPPEPSLGVTLSDERQKAVARAKWRKRKVDPAKLPPAGLRVTGVFVGSPAARAGVCKEDFWLAVGGKSLERLNQVREAIASLQPGGKLEVRYRRDGKERELTIRPD